jgi:hypothetical protein
VGSDRRGVNRRDLRDIAIAAAAGAALAVLVAVIWVRLAG